MKVIFETTAQALRSVRRQFAFSLTAILTLAVGITASCLVFTLVEGVLIRPLPFPEPEKIVTLWQTNLEQGIPREEVSPANFVDWKERASGFQTLALVQPFGFDYNAQGDLREYSASLVSAGFFETFSVPALLGRPLSRRDYQPDALPVAVMSEDLWRRDFGADPSLIGKSLILDGANRSLVGVMPRAFQFPSGEEFWAPRQLTEGDRQRRRSTFLQAVGRIEPGISVEQVQSQMNSLAVQLEEEYPAANSGVGIEVVPLYELTVSQSRPALLVFLASVGFLLLIACANVGGLQLNQGIRRLKEFSIRSAIGASRKRLVTQLVMEGVVVAVAATLVALFLTTFGLGLLLEFLPGELPRQSEIDVNLLVFAFTGGVSLICVLLFSLAPALALTRMDLFGSIRSSQGATESTPQRRLRGFFMTAQVAVSLVLLVGAGLLFRSYLELEWTDPGFERSNLVALQVFPDMEPARTQVLYQDVLREATGLPGVSGVAGVLSLPLSGEQSIELTPTVQFKGRPQLSPGGDPVVDMTVATANYFRVMGIPMLEGRTFRSSDTADAPIVGVINQAMARRFWPQGDVLGQKLYLNYAQGLDVEVIGVVGNVRHVDVYQLEGPRIYLPYTQGPAWSMTFVARTTVPPETLITGLKELVWEAGYQRPIDRVATLEGLFAESIREEGFRAWLTGVFASLALFVISVGLYSMVSFGVAYRRREVGIRKALGASSAEILMMTLAGSLRKLALGAALGTAAALGLSRLLSSFLYQVQPADPTVLGGALSLLLLVAFLASWLPARRASRVSPLLAIRRE